MRKNDKKIFLDKPTLYRMLNLRKTGLTVTTLAIMFNCDYSSIRAQCDKYGIEPLEEVWPERITGGMVYGIERIIAEIIPHYQTQTNYKVVNGERINLGKSYAEYIAESKKYPQRNRVTTW